MKEGIIATFLEAGAVVCNPNCGPCDGSHEGIMAEGEVSITTFPRNFKGRMGKGAEIYLASPVSWRRRRLKRKDYGSAEVEAGMLHPHPSLRGGRRRGCQGTEIIMILEGNVWVFGENINTDLILPGNTCE